jgi:hypothetical protein
MIFRPNVMFQGSRRKSACLSVTAGSDIGGVIPVRMRWWRPAKLSDVVVAESVGYGCSGDSMLRIEQMIKEHGS